MYVCMFMYICMYICAIKQHNTKIYMVSLSNEKFPEAGMRSSCSALVFIK